MSKPTKTTRKKSRKMTLKHEDRVMNRQGEFGYRILEPSKVPFYKKLKTKVARKLKNKENEN